MWVPAGAFMMLLALALFAAWLGAVERRRSLSRTEEVLRSLDR